MMCLPASSPALALRTWLGLGLFVLLCLGIGKERVWECGKGLQHPCDGQQGMIALRTLLVPSVRAEPRPGFGVAGASLRSPQLSTSQPIAPGCGS